MTLDLPTLLLTRIGVDVLISLTFWALMRRYPAIGGPGWWALSGLFSVLGALSAALPREVGGLMALAIASLASNTALGFVWLGLRSYLGLTIRRRFVALAVMLLAVLHLLVYFGQPWPAVRHLLFAATVLTVGVLILRDLHRADPRWRVPEFKALGLLVGIEVGTLLFVSMYLLWSGRLLTDLLGPILLVFLLTKLLRAVLCGALLSLRLRQETEQAVKTIAVRDAQSNALVDQLGAGVILFRPDRSVLRVNAEARRFLGWPAKGAPPETMEWRLLRADGERMARHEVPFERVLATGLPVSNFVGGIQIGDEVRWALCNAFPENDAIGGLRHVVFTFVDITSLKQAQQQQRVLESQLAQSQKMEALGTLAGGVAHDFNNILAAILGNADLARQDLEPGSPARDSLHQISGAARRGRELVRQILAFSRQQPLVRTAVGLRDIVSEITTLLRTAITPQIQLVVDVPADTPAIRADATQLGQVLLNLGTNAIHALEGRAGRIEYRVEALLRGDHRLPGEVAEVCVELDVDAVCVSVSDDGCGMSPATRERMFEPFFTTKPVGSGTGLGLPVVLGIVQAHGGAIEVDSAPDQGTRFRLYFPAATALGAAVAPSESQLPGTMLGTVTPAATPAAPAAEELIEMAEETTAAPRHILYLDDDDTLVFLVRRLLERRGYKVTTFTDQDQAIEAVRNQPDAFHLLMTDFNMPGMSGLDVARAVLAINPGLPVAVASGYITDELQEQALAAGVREVVFKTDAVEAFCEIVARLVTPPRPA